MSAPAEHTRASPPSAAACAEAAAWIARLHGENRTASVEAGFRRWLETSPEHRSAFEMANEIWLEPERLPKPAPPVIVRWPKAALVITVPRALAAAVIAMIVIGFAVHFRDPDLATRVGEQRNLSLEDGTRISLNTSSRVRVHYDRAARRVELDEGEAYFEVAKHPDWPFIVTAGGRQIVARGTAFLVRRDEEGVAVTLVEGKVTVAPAGEVIPTGSSARAASSTSAPPSSIHVASSRASADDITLSPGQRLTFVDHQTAPRLDSPPIERVTAWQHGQVILDHTPLSDAVAEMNRYNDVQLTIEGPGVAKAQVTGIFRVGDSQNFAEAVAETYHLQVVDRGGEIVISGTPPE
jgi:transmembrane sensor